MPPYLERLKYPAPKYEPVAFRQGAFSIPPLSIRTGCASPVYLVCLHGFPVRSLFSWRCMPKRLTGYASSSRHPLKVPHVLSDQTKRSRLMPPTILQQSPNMIRAAGKLRYTISPEENAGKKEDAVVKKSLTTARRTHTIFCCISDESGSKRSCISRSRIAITLASS